MQDVRNTPGIMRHRIAGAEPGVDGGAFQIGAIRVIASWGGGWDHVSVSLEDRCPTWDEMEIVRRMFFYPTEVVVQYGLDGPNRVNCHPYCLHWWRKQDEPFPMPPVDMV